MPATGATPDLVDIYLLDQQMQADRSCSLEQLQERDHAVGRECVGATDTSSLMKWLVAVVEKPVVQPAVWLNEANAALLLRLFALLAGLITMGQPAARAGPALRVIIAAGKFQGVMAAHTPMGSFSTTIRRSGRLLGMVSP